MSDLFIQNPANSYVYSGSGVCPTSASNGRIAYRNDSYYFISTGSNGGTFVGEFQARIPDTWPSASQTPVRNSWVPIVANNMTIDGLSTIVTGSGLYWLPAVNGLETRINFTAMSVSGAIAIAYVTAA